MRARLWGSRGPRADAGGGGIAMDKKPVRRESTMNRSEFRPVQSEASLGRDIQSKIGEQLRALYDDVLDQGVPDRFVDLLRQLEDKDDGERR